jgi:hypothetical protein
MRKNISIPTMSLLSLMIASTYFAYAQDATTVAPTGTMKPAPTGIMRANVAERQNARMDAQTAIADLRADKKEAVAGIRAEASSTREMIRGGLAEMRTNASSTKADREALHADLQKQRADFKVEIEAKRAEAKIKIEARRTELQGKLSALKDERKKNVALQVNDKFQTLNQKAVDTLSNSLTRQEDVIQKIKDGASALTAEGKDVSLITSKLPDIEAKIASNRSQLTAQSAKVYTIEVTTEANLKANTEATRDALKKDIDTLRDSVKSVSDMIREVAKALATIQ